MEIHDPNLHRRLIEMCDCYLGTDYPAAIQKIADSPSENLEEDALRYLALALLHGINAEASQFSLKRKNEKITATIKHDAEKTALRPPSRRLFTAIIATVRAILHLDEDKGALPLALGLKNDQIDLLAKIERTGDKESLKIKLPQHDR